MSLRPPHPLQVEKALIWRTTGAWGLLLDIPQNVQSAIIDTDELLALIPYRSR
jgi:hypothetical protein